MRDIINRITLVANFDFLLLDAVMSQNTEMHYNSPRLSTLIINSTETTTSTEPKTPLSSTFSPVDRSALPLGYLVPANRPALLAISKAREEGSEYHTNFITEVEFRECANTPSFELALGGLPEHPSVDWRIGRGRNGVENKGVEFLLITEDSNIACVHASFDFLV
jgi:hypothetical protein